jgi:TonB family protein
MKNVLLCFQLICAVQMLAQAPRKSSEEKWGLVDFDEEILFPYELDKEPERLDSVYIVEKNGKKGLINQQGRLLVPLEYTELSAYQFGNNAQNGYLIANRSINRQRGWGIISRKNEVILPLEYQYVSCIDANVFAAIPPADTIIQLMDQKRNLFFTLPGKYLKKQQDSCEALVVRQLNGSGDRLCDQQGRLLPPEVTWMAGEVEIFRSAGQLFGLRKKNGSVLAPPEYQKISPVSKTLFKLIKDDKNGIMNADGRWIVPFSANQETEYSNGIILVQQPGSGASTAMNTAGSVVAEGSEWRFKNWFQASMFTTHTGALIMHQYVYLGNEKNEKMVFNNGRIQHRARRGEYDYATEQHPILWKTDRQHQLLDKNDQPMLDSVFQSLQFTRDPTLFLGARQGRWGLVRTTDRGTGAVMEYTRIEIAANGYIIAQEEKGMVLLSPNGKRVGARMYRWMSPPNQYAYKYFGRMPGFKGPLVATAQSESTPEGWVIGLNERGQEFLLDLDNKIKQTFEKNKPAAAPVIREEVDEAPPALPLTQENPLQYPATPAVFPGGAQALSKQLIKDLKYPAIARENGIEGNVVIRVVVEKDGRLSNPVVVKGIQRDCDAEALRLVRLLPPFSPALENGRAVRSSQDIKVTFRLE